MENMLKRAKGQGYMPTRKTLEKLGIRIIGSNEPHYFYNGVFGMGKLLLEEGHALLVVAEIEGDDDSSTESDEFKHTRFRLIEMISPSVIRGTGVRVLAYPNEICFR